MYNIYAITKFVQVPASYEILPLPRLIIMIFHFIIVIAISSHLALTSR